MQRLRSALAAIPGVTRVATVEERPLSGDGNASVVNVPGRPFSVSSNVVWVNHVSDSFFETLGIRLLAGRTFTPADMEKDSDAVIVDDLFVRRFYERRNPLEEQFGLGLKPTSHYRIVGVVRSSRYNSLRKPNAPLLFFPSATASHPGWRVNFVLRTTLSTEQVSRAFRRASAAAGAGVPVIAIETQTGLIDALLRSERLLSIFSAAFGMLALLLSSIGLLGLLAYMVARRRNEIGVRMALGASRGRVAGMVVRDAFVLLTMGLAGGLPGAILIGQTLKHSLFQLQPVDPLTALLVFAMMVTVVALSSAIPARRAASIDPMVALREE